MVKKVSFAEFVELKESASNKVLVVDFFAPWCGPCRALGQTLEELSNMYDTEIVEFVAINVDDAFVEVQAIGIRNVPTVHIMFGGESKWQAAGALDKDTLRTAIESVIDACFTPQSEV
jgi:thioredoxin 1